MHLSFWVSLATVLQLLVNVSLALLLCKKSKMRLYPREKKTRPACQIQSSTVRRGVVREEKQHGLERLSG